jgi:plastocyanin
LIWSAAGAARIHIDGQTTVTGSRLDDASVMKHQPKRIARTLLLLVGILGAGTALTACGPLAFGSCTPKAGSTATGTAAVQVVSDPNTIGTYKPENVTIHSGESVTWSWQDQGNQHSVTADDGSYDSCLQKAGSTFTVAFSKPGTYTYKCSIHSQMTGRITVS